MTVGADGSLHGFVALATGQGPAVLIWFALAVACLGSLEIALPRGDAIGVSGAIDLVALLTLGAGPAAVVCTVGIGTVLLTRRTSPWSSRIFSALARASALFAAICISLLLGLGEVEHWATWFFAVTVYLIVNVLSSQVLTAVHGGRSILRAISGGAAANSALACAQASAALLGVIVYPTLEVWSLLVVVALLVLTRQSYALLQDVRETYRMTIHVLVEAAEESHSVRRGHAERTAQIARGIASRCGLSSSEVERISYAALLHDIGRLSSGVGGDGGGVSSSTVIDGVEFFDDIAGIVMLTDGLVDPHEVDDAPELLSAYIVSLASEFDECGLSVVPSEPGVSSSRLASAMEPSAKTRVQAALRHMNRVFAVGG